MNLSIGLMTVRVALSALAQIFLKLGGSRGKGVITLAVLIAPSPVFAATEQCRLIDAKKDRQASYDRQANSVAAKRKPIATNTRLTPTSGQSLPKR